MPEVEHLESATTLDVRKSVAEVGAASHAEYEDKIRDLIYNNNMACSMAAPK